MNPKDVVVDTMVFAYGLLGVTEYREAALRALHRAGDIIAPDSLRAELLNVVWQWARQGGLTAQTGLAVLQDADQLVAAFVPTDVLWDRALELSLGHNLAAYDTLFIALAELADTRLLTYDRKLLAAFPERAVAPAIFLA